MRLAFILDARLCFVGLARADVSCHAARDRIVVLHFAVRFTVARIANVYSGKALL